MLPAEPLSEEVKRFSGGVERQDKGSDQAKYLEKADELIMPARTTMQDTMRDIQVHNDQLHETIDKSAAIKNFVKDNVDNQVEASKDFYLSLTEVDVAYKVYYNYNYT